MANRSTIIATVLFALCSLNPSGAETIHKVRMRHDQQGQKLIIIEKNCDSEAFKNDSDCKATEDKESTVAVSKLPSEHVTIDANARRDNYDWIAYGAGIGLFIVGIFGVWVAVVTVRTVKRQVDTFVSKERARITIVVQPFNPSEAYPSRMIYDNSPMPPATFNVNHVEFCITNSGETNAFVRRALCKACVKELNWDARDETINSQINLPNVMHPHEAPFRHRTAIETGHLLKSEIDKDTAQAIADGTLGIYVIGHVEFGDVFDNHWAVKICRKWGGWWFGGEWQGSSVWHDYEPEGTVGLPLNGDFRIKQPSTLRRILRTLRRKKPNIPVIEIT